MNKYMDYAIEQSNMSTCIRRHVGAIAVKNDEIIASGYNNQVGGISPCTKVGCIRNKLNIPSGERREMCRYICAEQVIISEAARRGESLDGADIYITSYPCAICAKLLVSAGVKKIICKDDHKDLIAEEFFKEVGMKVEIL